MSRAVEDPRANEATDRALDLVSTLMERDGVSRSDLARRLGVNRSVVTDTFRRQRSVSVASLSRMLAALGYELQFAARPAAHKGRR